MKVKMKINIIAPMQNSKFMILAYISLFVLIVIVLAFVMPSKSQKDNSSDSSFPSRDNFPEEKTNYEHSSHSYHSNNENFDYYDKNDAEKLNVNSRNINNLDISTAWEIYKATHLGNIQIPYQNFKECLYALYLITKVADKEDFTPEEMKLLSDFDDIVLKQIKTLNNELFNDLFVKPYEFERLLSYESSLFTFRWQNEDYHKIQSKPSFKKSLNIFRILTRNNADEFISSDIKEDIFRNNFRFAGITFSSIDFMIFNWLIFMANPYKP